MVTKHQLQNMLDETIEELEKPNAAMQGDRYLQLIFHRANLQSKIDDYSKEPVEDEYRPVPKEVWVELARQGGYGGRVFAIDYEGDAQ